MSLEYHFEKFPDLKDAVIVTNRRAKFLHFSPCVHTGLKAALFRCNAKNERQWKTRIVPGHACFEIEPGNESGGEIFHLLGKS
jgi:hypothetical protein